MLRVILVEHPLLLNWKNKSLISLISKHCVSIFSTMAVDTIYMVTKNPLTANVGL